MNMKNRLEIKSLLLCSVLGLALHGCGGATAEKDTVPPEILSAGSETCPLNCEEFSRGSVLEFAYNFSDNFELGSYNLEIHNNFDHHTHSTEAGECRQDAVKEAVKPWIFNKDYTIPSGSKHYEARISIPVPDDVDLGEYHFMIRLTDSSGWQELRSVGIRITE